MLGYEPEELLGADVRKLGCHACRDEALRPEDLCPVHRTLKTGEAHRAGRAVFRRKDGTTLYAECTSQPVIEGGEARGAAVTVVDSSERGRAEDALSRYAAILEATTDFVGMADVDGRVLYVNRAGREMVGAGEDEDLSRTAVADYHPRWAAEVVLGEGIPTALREGSWSGETALLSRDGKETPVSQVILAHRGPDGEVRFLSTTARDVTDLKRAQDELAQSRRMFESIAEATPDLLYVSELAGGRNVYANRQAERILGYDQEQLAAFGGSVNDELLHPEDKARALANWTGLASLGDGEVQEHEFRARHADGRYRWLRARNVVLARTGDGRPRRVLGVAQDVTERKRAEEERERLLEESEGRAAELDAVIRSIPDAVYVGDETGIKVCNDAALEMLGFKSVAELNEGIPLLADRLQNRFAATGRRIPPEEEPFVRALRGETVDEEVIARHLKTGRDVVVRCAAAPIFVEGRIVGAVAVNTDITEHKLSEERLRHSARLLENVQDAVIATDERFVVTAWNEGAKEMYGWTADEVLGRYVGEVIGAELTEEQRAEARRELNETGRSRNELITHRKDGAAVYVEGVTATVRGDHGRITGYLSINRDVTERKEAEEALQESHRRTEDILESFTDAFFAVDREWRFTYVNERALRRMRRAKGEELKGEEVLGENLWEEFPGLVGTVFDRKYHEAMRGQETAEFEAHYPPADTWFEVHAYPSEEGFSVYFQDITGRKRAEKELRDSEERFQALATATFEGIAVHEDGVMVEANDALAEMFGYDPPEVIGESALTLAAPESRELIRKNIASGYEAPYEAVGQRKDGTRFEVEIRGRPFEYKGRLVRATAIRDISERKRVEDELKNSEKRFRAFFETAAVGAAQTDPATGRFINVNQSLCRIVGYEREELLSMGFSEITHPDDLARDLTGLSRLLRGEIGEYVAEKRYMRKDGRTVWGLLAVSLVRDAYGQPLQTVAITQDISERKRVEEELLEIREGERRRIARDLHDVVLQDLAAALQAVQATRIRSAEPHEELDQAADTLRRTARSLRNVVHDLRLEEGQPFTRAVEAPVMELDRQLAPACKVSLEVESGFPLQLPRKVEVELLRIVQEALANARRHSGAGRIAVALSSEEGWVGIEISDDGGGFDPAAVEGSSFGLSGMEERARSLGSRLEVSSALGEGTRVSVKVPAKP